MPTTKTTLWTTYFSTRKRTILRGSSNSLSSTKFFLNSRLLYWLMLTAMTKISPIVPKKTRLRSKSPLSSQKTMTRQAVTTESCLICRKTWAEICTKVRHPGAPLPKISQKWIEKRERRCPRQFLMAKAGSRTHQTMTMKKVAITMTARWRPAHSKSGRSKKNWTRPPRFASTS